MHLYHVLLTFTGVLVKSIPTMFMFETVSVKFEIKPNVTCVNDTVTVI